MTVKGPDDLVGFPQEPDSVITLVQIDAKRRGVEARRSTACRATENGQLNVVLIIRVDSLILE